LQGNWRLGTTTVVYLTKNGLLASDSRADFRGGRTSLLLPPDAETPSYATGICTLPVLPLLSRFEYIDRRTCPGMYWAGHSLFKFSHMEGDLDHAS